MPFNLDRKRIPRTDPILGLIQGNILSPYGRKHSRYIFFRLTSRSSGIATVAQLAKLVTSAQMQQEMRSQALTSSKANRPKQFVFANLLLSAIGYEQLGLSEVAKNLSAADFAAAARDLSVDDKTLFAGGLYWPGMADTPSTKAFHDDVQTWQPELQTSWHGLLWITSDDQSILATVVAQATAQAGAANCHVEFGQLLHNAADQSMEHFGYADGISQPLFFDDAIGPSTKWDPSAPLSLGLLPDPGVAPEEGYGSFFVFRKLEQDVAKFDAMVTDIAKAIDPMSPQDHKDRAGAMLVGRFKDGTPLGLQQTPTAQATNDFSNQAEDPQFTRCPAFAHTRRANPRADLTDQSEFVRSSRIIRRAVPYIAQEARPGCGLLFGAFMASIVGQFATIQRLWANSLSLIQNEPGLDPVIGHVPPGTVIPPHQFPKTWDGPKGDTVSVSLSEAVKMRGGEYFFAPSIPFLQRLGQTTGLGD